MISETILDDLLQNKILTVFCNNCKSNTATGRGVTVHCDSDTIFDKSMKIFLGFILSHTV